MIPETISYSSSYIHAVSTYYISKSTRISLLISLGYLHRELRKHADFDFEKLSTHTGDTGDTEDIGDIRDAGDTGDTGDAGDTGDIGDTRDTGAIKAIEATEATEATEACKKRPSNQWYNHLLEGLSKIV